MNISSFWTLCQKTISKHESGKAAAETPVWNIPPLKGSAVHKQGWVDVRHWGKDFTTLAREQFVKTVADKRSLSENEAAVKLNQTCSF